MTTSALIPIGPLAQAKSRLSPLLPPAARRQLQIAMLKDVLSALRRVRQVIEIVVVTPDSTVEEIARSHAVQTLREKHAMGLNAAAAAGSDLLCGNGASLILILPGDVPLLEPADVDILIKTAYARRKSIAVPDRHADGTNGLAFMPPSRPAFSYGRGSFRRHLLGDAREPARALTLPSFGLDVDTPADLALLGSAPKRFRAFHTSAVLDEISPLLRQMEPQP